MKIWDIAKKFMKPPSPSLRVYFLIMVAAVEVGIPFWRFLIVLYGYMIFEQLDHWLTKRARVKEIWKEIENEVYGWEPDPEDLEWEDKGNLRRLRLTGNERVIVTRVVLCLGRIAMIRR
jgi:hypothetical protein